MKSLARYRLQPRTPVLQYSLCKTILHVRGTEKFESRSQRSKETYLLECEFEQFLQLRISMQVFTHSKSLFEIINRGSITSVRKLTIDTLATKEVYKPYEITDIGLNRLKHNLTDCITKSWLENNCEMSFLQKI